MFSYIVKKFGILILSLFLIASITFFLMKIIPGNPFLQEQAIPEEILKSMYVHYGLDKPLFLQYLQYLKGLIFFDLGPSFKYESRSVNDIIQDGFPVSAVLGLESLILSISIGIALGSLAALYRGKWQDHLCMLYAVLGISIPNFILATFLQYIFAMKLNLLPVARWGSFSQTILPSISLAALPTAFIARLTKSSMIEILQQDYIQTAKAKGLPLRKIFFRHVLKNSLLPVITYIGPLSAAILTGSFVVEKIFGIPGLGGWFVTSITNRDYTVIMGVTIFYSAILLVLVFCIDIVYPLFDPRIRLCVNKKNACSSK